MSVECDQIKEAEGTVEYQATPEEPLSRAVLEAVSRVSGREIVALGDDDVETLPPLFDAIDPEALDSLFHPGKGNEARGCVSFTYFDYEVTVDSTGAVSVVPVGVTPEPVSSD